MRRRAFSLIEMLLATMLLSMLLVAVSGMIARFAKDTRDYHAQVGGGDRPGWLARVAGLIERDLRQAHQIEVLESALWLTTFVPPSGEDESAPGLSHVVYRVTEDANGTPWLVRRVQPVFSTSNADHRVDPVCRGVQAIGFFAGERSAEAGWRSVSVELSFVEESENSEANAAEDTERGGPMHTVHARAFATLPADIVVGEDPHRQDVTQPQNDTRRGQP